MMGRQLKGEGSQLAAARFAAALPPPWALLCELAHFDEEKKAFISDLWECVGLEHGDVLDVMEESPQRCRCDLCLGRVQCDHIHVVEDVATLESELPSNLARVASRVEELVETAKGGGGDGQSDTGRLPHRGAASRRRRHGGEEGPGGGADEDRKEPQRLSAARRGTSNGNGVSEGIQGRSTRRCRDDGALLVVRAGRLEVSAGFWGEPEGPHIRRVLGTPRPRAQRAGCRLGGRQHLSPADDGRGPPRSTAETGASYGAPRRPVRPPGT